MLYTVLLLLKTSEDATGGDSTPLIVTKIVAFDDCDKTRTKSAIRQALMVTPLRRSLSLPRVLMKAVRRLEFDYSHIGNVNAWLAISCLTDAGLTGTNRDLKTIGTRPVMAVR